MGRGGERKNLGGAVAGFVNRIVGRCEKVN